MSFELSAPSGGISRRGFLSAGGALVGAALLLGPTGTPTSSPLAKLASRARVRLPVAYVDGSKGATTAELAQLLAAGGARAVPAESLRSGGVPRDGGTAHIRIEGSGTASAVTAAQLDALVAPAGATAESDLVPFYAWTMQAASANGVGFVVPFERQPSIGLTMRTRNGDGAAWSESTAILTCGSERSLPKLAEGAYLVGLDPTAWRSPTVLPPVTEGTLTELASVLVAVHAI